MNSEFETGKSKGADGWREAVHAASEALLANLPLMVCGAVVLLAMFADLLG